jgi:hypothetical protein
VLGYSEFAAATRQRLEEASKRKEAEQQDAAARRHVRQEYRTGKLDEAEKAKRLAEMMGNADVHEEARWERLKRARRDDDEEPGEKLYASVQCFGGSGQCLVLRLGFLAQPNPGVLLIIFVLPLCFCAPSGGLRSRGCSFLALTFAGRASNGAGRSATAAFLTAATKEVYGTAGDLSQASLEDRVGRRKFYSDRSKSDDKNAFRR